MSRLRATTALLAATGLLSGCGREDESAPAADAARTNGDTVATREVASSADTANTTAPPDSAPPVDTATAEVEPFPEEVATAAYAACRDSVAATLPDPAAAIWGELPDNVKPSGEPGRWAVVAQVRPDPVSTGVSYACVVEESGGRWRVVSLQTEAPPEAPTVP